MRIHFSNLKKIYGQQSLVNLVNQQGHEKPVKEAYERHVAEVGSHEFPIYSIYFNDASPKLDLPDVKYEYFDFHTECRKMRWDRISALIDQIKEEVDKDE